MIKHLIDCSDQHFDKVLSKFSYHLFFFNFIITYTNRYLFDQMTDIRTNGYFIDSKDYVKAKKKKNKYLLDLIFCWINTHIIPFIGQISLKNDNWSTRQSNWIRHGNFVKKKLQFF